MNFIFKKSVISYASHYQVVKHVEYTERHYWEHYIQPEVIITTPSLSVAPNLSVTNCSQEQMIYVFSFLPLLSLF